MSDLKYCQGTSCHEYKTKDRIRGMKGQKYYSTRRRSDLLWNNFCSQRCADDWLEKNADRAINYFGRITEPKRVECDGAWYKDRDCRNDNYYFVNDLLGERVAISERHYQDNSITKPTDRYQTN